MTKDKKENRVTIKLNGRELQILEECLKNSGSTASEFIRGLVKREHAKLFPAYRQLPGVRTFKPQDEQDMMTDEQLCEARGGEVAIGTNREAGLEGQRVCLWRTSKFSTDQILLVDRETIKKHKIIK